MSELTKALRSPVDTSRWDDPSAIHPDVAEEAADRIEALEAENGKLRSAFRVNMIRLLPQYTHAEIDAEIEKAVSK